jgi:hypothetical protein
MIVTDPLTTSPVEEFVTILVVRTSRVVIETTTAAPTASTAVPVKPKTLL